MVNQLHGRLAEEFPDYMELVSLLNLAAVTWPRFGLSVKDLSELDYLTLEFLRVAIWL